MKIFIPSFIVVFLDQLSKLWIKNNIEVWNSVEILGSFLRFSHVKNTGIAFGISVGDYKLIIVILGESLSIINIQAVT